MSGSLYQALTGAKSLISLSSAFQTRTGAANATAALASIYCDAVQELILQPGETLARKRPFALVCVDAHGYVQIGEGARHTLGGTGGIFVLLSDNARTPDDHQASFLDFVDWTSTVFDEISELPGRNQYWPFNHFELVEPHFRPPLTERASDDYWLCGYLLSHHINGGGK